MLKNRIISVLLWVVFLLWVYGRDRLTEKEHLQLQISKTASDPRHIARMKEFEEMLKADPQAKASYYEYLYEVALEEIEEP